MTDRRGKLWTSLAQRPNAVRFEELQRLLELSGWTLERSRGSHHVFGKGGHMVVIPRRTPHVKAVYVKEVVRLTHPELTAEE